MIIHCPPFDGQVYHILDVWSMDQAMAGQRQIRADFVEGELRNSENCFAHSWRLKLAGASYPRAGIPWNIMESHWIRSERATYPRNHWAALACRIGLGLHFHWTTDLESWNSWNISVVKRIAGFLCRWWLGSSGLNSEPGCWLHHFTGLGQDSWAFGT